jgi:hypothetical protein
MTETNANDRAIAVLRMLASDAEGERNNAAAILSGNMRKRGMLADDYLRLILGRLDSPANDSAELARVKAERDALRAGQANAVRALHASEAVCVTLRGERDRARHEAEVARNAVNELRGDLARAREEIARLRAGEPAQPAPAQPAPAPRARYGGFRPAARGHGLAAADAELLTWLRDNAALTGWERGFVLNVLRANRELSEAQRNVLNRMATTYPRAHAEQPERPAPRVEPQPQPERRDFAAEARARAEANRPRPGQACPF